MDVQTQRGGREASHGKLHQESSLRSRSRQNWRNRILWAIYVELVDEHVIYSDTIGWGARYAALFTHSNQEVQIDAAVAYHPTGLSVPSEIEPISKPVKIIVGDKDSMMSVSQTEEVKDIFDEMNKNGRANGSLEIQVVLNVCCGSIYT
jgi:dienelactone hydrolase